MALYNTKLMFWFPALRRAHIYTCSYVSRRDFEKYTAYTYVPHIHKDGLVYGQTRPLRRKSHYLRACIFPERLTFVTNINVMLDLGHLQQCHKFIAYFINISVNSLYTTRETWCHIRFRFPLKGSRSWNVNTVAFTLGNTYEHCQHISKRNGYQRQKRRETAYRSCTEAERCVELSFKVIDEIGILIPAIFQVFGEPGTPSPFSHSSGSFAVIAWGWISPLRSSQWSTQVRKIQLGWMSKTLMTCTFSPIIQLCQWKKMIITEANARGNGTSPKLRWVGISQTASIQQKNRFMYKVNFVTDPRRIQLGLPDARHCSEQLLLRLSGDTSTRWGPRGEIWWQADLPLLRLLLVPVHLPGASVG